MIFPIRTVQKRYPCPVFFFVFGDKQRKYGKKYRNDYEDMLSDAKSESKESSLDDSNNDELSLSFMKSIEDTSNRFIKERMMSKYLLMKMGLNVKNMDYHLIREQLYKHKPDIYNDDLYYNLNDLKGLKLSQTLMSNMDKTTPRASLDLILNSIVSFLDNKMMICDLLLMLCFEYCYNDSNQDNMKYFIGKLAGCGADCLKDDASMRDYYYFKEYILFSDIWFCKGLKNDELLFDIVDQLVDKQLIKQQQYIFDSAQNEEKLDNQHWNQLCNYCIPNFNNCDTLRQDSIEYGIVPYHKEKSIYVLKSQMTNNGNDNFDIKNELDTKVYLTRCLTFSHANNEHFQNEMSKIFNDINKELKIQCVFAKAPVKTYDRCVVKSNTDYSFCTYPSVAHILDFLRCSITFDDPKSMLNGLNLFIKLIQSGKISCIKSILRIKNGFNAILTWKDFNDAEYCDIKLNLIYESPNWQQRQIVEVQFLLKFLLKAKKLGHKYYNIKRRKKLMYSVSNLVYNVNEDFENYKNKIVRLIEQHNVNDFAKQLFLRPNLMAGLIVDKDPLLLFIGEDITRKNNLKLYELFLDHLFFFNDVLMQCNEKDENAFLRRYFNFNKLDDCIVRSTRFVE